MSHQMYAVPATAVAANAATTPAGASSSASSIGQPQSLPDGLTLAPIHMLPPLVSAYLPSQPIPSIVDHSRQRADQISLLQLPSKTGEPTTLQVRKRQHVTDMIRMGHRKKHHGTTPQHHQVTQTGQSGLQVKELPDRLDINLPESGLVNQLLGLEKRLDATIARKHVEIQQALHPAVQQPQILRLFIWHEQTTPLTREELMNGLTTHDKPEEKAWMLKIQGQILDAGEPQSQQSHSVPLPPATRCLANYLAGMIVQIEPKAAGGAAAPSTPSASSSSSSTPPPQPPQIETVEWRKHSAVALSDGFELRRKFLPGYPEVQLQINLFLDFSPPRFRLSPGLAQALGFPTFVQHNPLPLHGATPNPPTPFPAYETQNNVLQGFWEYVKKKGLQDGKDPTIVKCDPTLQSLFGVTEIPVASVLSFLQLHLAPASSEPVVIPYSIKPLIPAPAVQIAAGGSTVMPAPSPSAVTCYDILTWTPILPNVHESYKEAVGISGLKTVPPPSMVAQAAKLTEKTVELMLEVEKCNRRREFLTAFSEAPTAVLQLLIAQQARDQLIMMGVTGVDDELERRGEYYHADWTHDAVDRMMAEDAIQAQNAMQASAGMFDETPMED